MKLFEINWKVRARNPQFWAQVFLAIAVPIGAYFGITGEDLATWGALWDVLVDAVSNPYVLFTMAVSVYNAIPDPTVSGLGDSRQALNYDKPRKDGAK